jgi:hypothetical protein
MIVVEGLDEMAILTIDLTKSRTAGDMLKILEYDAPSFVAAGATWVWRYRRNWLKLTGGRFRPTVNQVIEFVRDEPGIQNSVSYGIKASNSLKAVPSGHAGLHYIMSNLDEEDADDFFDKLTSGHELTEEHPISKARNFFIDQLKKNAYDRVSYVHQAAITAKAWNAYRKGEYPKVIRWSPGGKYPEPFPTLI